MLAEVAQREPVGELLADEHRGRVRDEDLAAVARGRDPRRSMDVETDIVGARGRAGRPRLAGMEAHPDPHRRAVRPGRAGEGALRRGGRRDGFERAREHREERVPLGAHLRPGVLRQRVAQDAAVHLEHRLPAVGPEPADRARRSFDVGEQHGQRPRGKGHRGRRHGAILRTSLASSAAAAGRLTLELVAVFPYLVRMRCPSCGNQDTRVVDSREAEDGTSIRRRRACDRCEARFTTFERSESARIQVLKRDGTRQEFDRRKLASAIEKAASKSLSPEKLGLLIDDVEASLKQSGASEVGSQRIGEMVLERLADVDPMSYIRFRIVYAKLDDLTDLRDELAVLDRRREVSRDRKVAEQIALPIEPVAIAGGGRKRRR